MSSDFYESVDLMVIMINQIIYFKKKELNEESKVMIC